jgi:Tfp pilus assembly protein PilX
MKTTHTTQQSGFVLLFGLLITAVIFVLGAGILSLAQKETILASTSTESQVALGVADTGLECGLRVVFGGQTDFVCAGQTATASTFGNQTTYTFDMSQIDSTSVSCGIVTVVDGATRGIDGVTTAGIEIQSRGFNVCLPSGGGSVLTPDTTNTLLLERKLVVWYALTQPATPPPTGGTGGTGTTTGGTPSGPPVVQ